MRGRVYAFLYDLLMAPLEWAGLRGLRRELVAPAEGRVLEVGVGTGLNLALYRRATSITAVDPDLAMLERASGRLARSHMPTLLVQARAEALPFSDGSFDEVVATLVFCTVGDPRRGFRELWRVLQPDGQLRLLEHVKSAGPILAAMQDLVTPAWSAAFGGCHPNRTTLITLRDAGFDVHQARNRLGDVLLTIVTSRAPRQIDALVPTMGQCAEPSRRRRSVDRDRA